MPADTMTPDAFRRIMAPVFDAIGDHPLDRFLAGRLNGDFPAGGEKFTEIEAACKAAIAEGWMCAQGGEGRRFGRVIEARPETNDLSVDVVQLTDVVGPHHIHPTGEICLTMPQDATAKFDGEGAGWCVNEPGSGHFPTVTGGEALVLYLLPSGEIEFTGNEPPEA